MANTAALVFQGHNHLRYLLTADEAGGTVTIANDGGATPDLQTDTLAGVLKQIARARIDGLGTLVAGVALNQAQARAILLSDGSTSVGNALVPRAVCFVTDRGGAVAGAALATVDANVDGQGDPVVIATLAADQIAYLDILMEGTIGS